MIGNILTIARSAIQSQQVAIQVTSQNLANAQTEGYSRQRADLTTAPLMKTSVGLLGSGVMVSDVHRTRNALLDTSYRREAGNAAEFSTRSHLLGQVEEVFNELSDSGFGQIMNAFWSSWSDLADTPTNGSVRGLIKQNGAQVAFALNNYAGHLSALKGSVSTQIERSVESINVLATQLADINRQVTIAMAEGGSAPDLLDQRDKTLDELAKLVQVNVIDRGNGKIGVTIGTSSLVDDQQARAVGIAPGPPPQLELGGTVLRGVGGSVGAMLDVRDRDIPSVLARLDDFAKRLVEEVNSIHRDGPPSAVGTGNDFFDPAGLTAATIKLSSDIADPEKVGTVGGAPSDNRVALALSGLREQAVTFSSGPVKTFSAFYGDAISDVGLKLNSADRSSRVYETLAQQADVRRASDSGVSTDEELMKLMRHQQSYAAATKLISVADEMVQGILALVR